MFVVSPVSHPCYYIGTQLSYVFVKKAWKPIIPKSNYHCLIEILEKANVFYILLSLLVCSEKMPKGLAFLSTC